MIPLYRKRRSLSISETEPYGPVDQPDFLNAVMEIETPLNLMNFWQSFMISSRKQDERG